MAGGVKESVFGTLNRVCTSVRLGLFAGVSVMYAKENMETAALLNKVVIPTSILSSICHLLGSASHLKESKIDDASEHAEKIRQWHREAAGQELAKATFEACVATVITLISTKEISEADAPKAFLVLLGGLGFMSAGNLLSRSWPDKILGASLMAFASSFATGLITGDASAYYCAASTAAVSAFSMLAGSERVQQVATSIWDGVKSITGCGKPTDPTSYAELPH